MTEARARQLVAVAARLDVHPLTVALLAGEVPGQREYDADADPRYRRRRRMACGGGPLGWPATDWEEAWDA